MMQRDERLTGHKRGQKVRIHVIQVCYTSLETHLHFQSDPVPPPGFDTSSVWYTERTY